MRLQEIRLGTHIELFFLTFVALAIVWIALPLVRSAQVDVWEPAIRRFEEQDRKSPPPTNEIVFVGASMIVRWDLEKFFPDLKTINRGFGGSEMIDSAHYADRIVIPYKPRIVVVYAGDNDLARGTTPEQIVKDFEAFADKVHRALPQTKIVVISVKPSIARWSLLDKQQQTNAMMRAYCEKHDYLVFADVASPMLHPDGKLRTELFVPDGLHANDSGYEIWTKVVRPLLQ